MRNIVKGDNIFAIARFFARLPLPPLRHTIARLCVILLLAKKNLSYV